MEFRNLYSFLKVHDLGSFSKAAEDLGYAQSTVTLHIQQLEDELGVPLFDRIGRKNSLTPYGTQLLDYARKILQLQEQVKFISRADRTKIGGTLHLGMVESITGSLLLSVIGEYRRRLPEVNVELRVAVSSDLFAMLRQGTADLIFTIGDRLSAPDLVCPCSHRERSVFIASPRNRLAGKKRLTAADVFAEPFILTGDNTFLQHELFKKAGECGLNIKSPLRTESSKIICELVAQDLGVSFLPEYMVRSPFQRSELAVLDVSDFSHSFSMCVYYHRDKWLTPQMAELIELVQAYWGKMSNE